MEFLYNEVNADNRRVILNDSVYGNFLKAVCDALLKSLEETMKPPGFIKRYRVVEKGRFPEQ